ncbi:hypothetical protein DSECCO2_624750 [anaerobic digester metagenome]
MDRQGVWWGAAGVERGRGQGQGKSGGGGQAQGRFAFAKQQFRLAGQQQIAGAAQFGKGEHLNEEALGQ